MLGSGYRLRSNGRTWASGSSQTGSYLCLNLALLPGHNAAKKQAVLAVFDGAFTSTGERAAVGHWAPLGGSGGSQSVLALSQVAGGLRWTAPTLRPCFYGPSVVDFAPADGVYSAVAASANFTFGAVRASDSHGYGVFAPYSGTLPRVEDARVIMGADSAYAAGGLYGGVGWAANSGVRNCIVKRIQFLQER